VRSAAVLLVAAFVAASSAGAAGLGQLPRLGRLPGVPAFKTCAAAGPFWPTETLAVSGTTGWLACKEESRVVKLDLRTHKTLRSIRIGSPVIAVALGYGSLWALDSNGTLTRISATSGRILRRIDSTAAHAYNVWIGAGSVWVAADQGAEVVRISPASNRVVGRAAVGDGPADMAFDGTSAWVIDHRDLTLFRIDTRTNAPTKVATLPGSDAAPERMVFLGGKLWITGRGADLMKVDPATGAVEATYEIGASGIDVVAAGGVLWVPARSAAVDRSGFPTMEALRRVSTTGTVTTVARARGRLDVHGLVAAAGTVWLADNTNGVLYRISTS
jgi:DNA-binding beta-propeller fold protein YncE